jgi:hypothetical protein
MARKLCRAGGQLTALASIKTIIQIVAAAHQTVAIREIGISFDGASVTATPVDVQVLFQTTAGTMSALTPVLLNDDDADTTINTTAQQNATVEPTAGNEVKRWFVHPQTGFVWQAQPFFDEILIKGGDRLGVKFATAPASVDCNFYVDFEE